MGVTLKDPEADVAAFLVAAGYTAERDVFAGYGYPLPQGLVVQVINGDGEPSPYLNGADPQAYVTSRVQVLVWGMPGRDGYVATKALALAVAGALQQATISGYTSVRLVGLPTQVGDAKAPRPVWSINLQVEYHAT